MGKAVESAGFIAVVRAGDNGGLDMVTICTLGLAVNEDISSNYNF